MVDIVTMGDIGANVSRVFGIRRGIWSVACDLTCSLGSVLSRERREGAIHRRIRFSKPERIRSTVVFGAFLTLPRMPGS